MRARLLVPVTLFLLGALTAGSLPDPSPAQQGLENHEEIKKRIEQWRTDPVLAPFTKGINFGAAPAPSPPAPGTAGRGYSIHVAVERVDETVYGKGVDELPAVKNDLRKMKEIALRENFTVLKELTDTEATRGAVLKALQDAAAIVKSGETLLVTYSGHGSETTDTNGDEERGMDQTWCLYDGQLLDDLLVDCWRRFEAGVRIIVVLDSCHSSTAARGIPPSEMSKAAEEFNKTKQVPLTQRNIQRVANLQVQRRANSTVKTRLLPIQARIASFALQEASFREIQQHLADLPELKNPSLLKPTVLVLAACGDDQTALDDNTHGFLTRALIEVWNNGSYAEPYQKFLNDIAARVKPRAQQVIDPDGQRHRQDPSFLIFGTPNPAFEKQLPFNRTR